jgi:hypothetical protein
LLILLTLHRNKLPDISIEEWKEIFLLLDFLEPFYIATKDFEGDQYPTLSITYPIIIQLMKDVNEFDCKGR